MRCVNLRGRRHGGVDCQASVAQKLRRLCLATIDGSVAKQHQASYGRKGRMQRTQQVRGEIGTNGPPVAVCVCGGVPHKKIGESTAANWQGRGTLGSMLMVSRSRVQGGAGKGFIHTNCQRPRRASEAIQSGHRLGRGGGGMRRN